MPGDRIEDGTHCRFSSQFAGHNHFSPFAYFTHHPTNVGNFGRTVPPSRTPANLSYHTDRPPGQEQTTHPKPTHNFLSPSPPSGRRKSHAAISFNLQLFSLSLPPSSTITAHFDIFALFAYRRRPDRRLSRRVFGASAGTSFDPGSS